MSALDMMSNDTVDNITCVQDNNIGIYMHMHIEQKIAEYLIKYISITLLIIGTIGNILSFLVFLRRTLRDSVMSFYLRALALGDLVVVWSLALPITINNIFGIDITSIHNVSCWLIIYLCHTSMLFSVWVLLTVTIERFVAVTFPHKMNIIFTHRQAYVSVVVFVLVAMCLNIHFMFSLKVITYPDQQLCCFNNASSFHYYSVYVHPWIMHILYSFIPIFVIIVCNIGIIYKVKARGKLLREMNVQNGGRPQTSMIAILLTISFTFVMLTMPGCLYLICMGNQPIATEPFMSKTKAVMWLIYIIFVEMLQMNHSLNFWIYVMTGTMFRREVFTMLKCVQPKPTKSATSDETQTTL